MLARYGGTRQGRQELGGELIEDRPDALWSRALIEASRVIEAPPLARIVVAIDPPGTSKPGADACGIVAAGRAANGWVYVLEDASAAGLSPTAWANKAVAVYRALGEVLRQEGLEGVLVADEGGFGRLPLVGVQSLRCKHDELMLFAGGFPAGRKCIAVHTTAAMQPDDNAVRNFGMIGLRDVGDAVVLFLGKLDFDEAGRWLLLGGFVFFGEGRRHVRRNVIG